MDQRIATVSDDGIVVPTGKAYGYTQLVVKDAESGIIRVAYGIYGAFGSYEF